MPFSIASIKQILRPTRRRINQLLGRDLAFRRQINAPSLRLGTEYGGWVVQPDHISRDAIVYCFGVGEDISFDRAMIERFGVTVHAFDPTPKSMQWIKSQSLPAQFVFHGVGLADYDGIARFVLPRADYVSYQISGNQDSRGADVAACRVQTLATIMRELNHDHLDVLKIDIEGAEYAALKNILDAKIAITQLLVEFHHTSGDRPSLAKTQQAIESLLAAGYRIFDVSPTGLEYSFLRQ